MTHPDPRQLLYRTLDPDAAARLTRDALARCDDGELYLQYSASESFGFDDGRLKTADYSVGSGFGLRGVSGETTGFAHANEISEAAIRRAADTLSLLDPATQSPSPAPGRTNVHLYTGDSPLDAVPFADKVALCQRIDAAARARDPRVVQVSVSLAGSWDVVEIVRADGFRATDIRPLVRLGVSLVVERAGRRETGFHGQGGRTLYDSLFLPETWNRSIDVALAQAIVNLDSVDAPAGEQTVLVGPGWPGVLLHEAVGPRAGGRLQPQGHVRLLRPAGRAGRRAGRHRGGRWCDRSPARIAVDRRRGHAHGRDRADRGRGADGLYAGPPQRAPDGRARDGQRPPPELRPRAHAAHDQHLHALGPGRSRRSC